MKKKKVVLYNPHAVFFDMPLALLAIGSALDQDRFEVIIVDARLEQEASTAVLEACEDALVFGVTALTGAPLKDALQMTRKVKTQFPNLTTVWGGWHPSLFLTETLEEEETIDITVGGQGEITFREIVDCLDQGGDLKLVDGIAYRTRDGVIMKNKTRSLLDMNDLPSINYELISVESYFAQKGRRQLDYISSTGCRFRCTFCADPFVYKRGWTAVSAEKMIHAFTELKKRYQFDDINFQDETFFTHRKRTNQIAQGLIDAKINTTWAATLRADQASRMSEAEFDLCKASGLRRVLVGVESGSQAMMDWLKKDIKLEQVYIAAERCKERGIAVIFPFIVGFPGETPESLEATLKVAKDLKSMAPNFETPIFYFKPYPGSAITQSVVEKGYELPKSIMEWADFDYIGSSGPWVDETKYKRIEQFKFYNNLAWRKRSWVLRPLQWMARLRMQFDYFQFPLEKVVLEKLNPQKQLS